MSYLRVIPRDFFNESKLLKCLGQFQLCIHDRTANGLPFEVDFDGRAFEIIQYDSDGALSVLNYLVSLNGEPVILYTPYNSKENYPLRALYRNEEYFVFDEKGKFMPNFGFKKSPESELSV